MSISDDELFATLRRKLCEAEESYKRAGEEYNRLVAVASSVADAEDHGFVAGTHALRHAMVVQRLALRRYHAALKELNDFVLREKLPDQE